MHAHPPAITRPRASPRAAPVTLQYGDAVQIGGQMFTVSPGAVLIPGTGPPPPPPPPPPSPAITGYRSGSSGQAVTSAAPGDLLLIEGSGFPALTAGASGRVLFNGSDARVLAWTPTEVQCVALGPPGAVFPRLYYQASPSDSPHLIAVGPALLITGGPPPPPPPPANVSQQAFWPFMTQFVDSGGQPVTQAKVGQQVAILGQGFGGAPGTVRYNGQLLPIVAWTDGRITVTLAVAPSPVSGWIEVRRPDGQDHLSGPVFRVLP